MLPKVLFKSGDIIACPKCLKPQIQLEHDVYAGQKFNHAMFRIVPGSLYKLDSTALVLSYCCGEAFLFNGALYLDRRGWVPYQPYPSKGAQTEEQRYLNKKKHFDLK